MLTPQPVESFQGLNLVGDPQEVGFNGAVDLLNVDLDRLGRIRSRDGSVLFKSTTRRVVDIARYTDTSQLPRLVVGFNIPAGGEAQLAAYNNAGTLIASYVPGAISSGTPHFSFAAYGTPSSSRTYAAISYAASSSFGPDAPRYFDGSAWAAAAGAPSVCLFTVTPDSNRLVGARYATTGLGTNESTVRFSNAGDPATWGANNYVDLHPGDGECIQGVCQWRDNVVVAKHSKLYWFYGESTDSSGNPVFNYRMVGGVGMSGFGGLGLGHRAILSGPDAVYFVNGRGVWATTGGDPTLISRPVDPIFTGDASPFFLGARMNQGQLSQVALGWHNDRLYVAYPSGTNTVNDSLLVFDPKTGVWVLWDLGAACFVGSYRFGIDQTLSTFVDELAFGPTGVGGSAIATGIGRHSSSYTDDNGTAITSRYRSGFADLGSSDMKRIHSFRLQGSGSPTLKLSTDFGALETGAALTLGTAPAVADDVRRYAPRGRQFSWQVGGTSPWVLNNLVANVAGKRRSGEHVSA